MIPKTARAASRWWSVVLAAVVLLPLAGCGGSAIFLDRTKGGGIAERVVADPAAGVFIFLNQFPLALPLSILTLVVLWVFFVAGADAGTIVLGSMSTGGPAEPKRWIKLAWGLAMAAIAGILLVAGGLGALQSASVLTGVPFAFIMVLMCVAFLKHLRTEARGGGQQGRADLDLAGSARETPSVRRRGPGRGPAPGEPAPGGAFTAEPPPEPGSNRQPGIMRSEIGEPGMEGR